MEGIETEMEIGQSLLCWGRKLHGQSSEKRENLKWRGMEFAKSEDDGMGRVDGEGRTGGGTYLGSQVRRR